MRTTTILLVLGLLKGSFIFLGDLVDRAGLTRGRAPGARGPGPAGARGRQSRALVQEVRARV